MSPAVFEPAAFHIELLPSALRILKRYNISNAVVERSRALGELSVQKVSGWNLTGDVRYHFEFFNPFPFLTARRNRYK